MAKGYFGDKGMLAYVEEVQRKELREGVVAVKRKPWQVLTSVMITRTFSGEMALKAGGAKNTANQFGH